MSNSQVTRRRFLRESTGPLALVAADSAVASLPHGAASGHAEPTSASAERGIIAAGPPREPVEAGLQLLRTGGNAIDAAVAAALAESAVNPNVSGLGGSGAMMIYLAAQRRCLAIDYNTRAPAEVDEQVFAAVLTSMLPDRRWRLRDAGWSPYELMTVPGCPAGLELAVRRYGRKQWPEVMAPAIAALDRGLFIHERLAHELPGMIARCDDDQARNLLTVKGRAPPAGRSLAVTGLQRVIPPVGRPRAGLVLPR